MVKRKVMIITRANEGSAQVDEQSETEPVGPYHLGMNSLPGVEAVTLLVANRPVNLGTIKGIVDRKRQVDCPR